MSATIHFLPPPRVAQPCRRCGGLRRVTFDQMSEAQQRWAPFGAIHPCPDCGDDAEIIPLLRVPVAPPRISRDNFDAVLADVVAELNRDEAG